MNTDIKILSEETGRDDVALLTLGGSLNSNVIDIVNSKIQETLKKNCQKIVFDLKDLEYISSAGLRILIYTAKQMRNQSGTAGLCHVRGHILKVLKISGTDKMFSIYEDREQALKTK